MEIKLSIYNPEQHTINAAFSAIFGPDGRLLVVGSLDGTPPRFGHGELELPGGGIDGHQERDPLSVAARETKEETGLDILSGDSEISVTVLSRSKERIAHTGLVIVQYAHEIPVDLSFVSPETTSLSLVDPRDFIALPTHEEDSVAERKTFRAHRIMAACALGITEEEIDPLKDPIEMMFAPFNNRFVTELLAELSMDAAKA